MDSQPSESLIIFLSEFLNAKTWVQRKDGVPLNLLDELSADDMKIAESELIDALSLDDSWPIRGLGHIRSFSSLPYLYNLLPGSNGFIRIAIAHAVFSINKDGKMIEEAIKATLLLTKQLPKTEYQLIDVIYLLPDFNDEAINKILHSLYNSNFYLIAYNAAKVLGYPTVDIVSKFS